MTRESGPFEVALRTDPGPRPENQDAAITAGLSDGRLLLAVADGMGGLKAGAEASRRALVRLERSVRAGQGLVDAIRAAHQAVQELAETDAAGSTIVAAVVSETGVDVAHVGDSRAYRCGGLGLVPLTRDHTVAAEAEARGELAAREVAGSRWGATLARALGTRGPVEPETLSLPPLEPGEWLVLTTDGVHGVLADEAIERVIAGAKGADTLAGALLSVALEAGADDNLSAVVLRHRSGLAATTPPEPVREEVAREAEPSVAHVPATPPAPPDEEVSAPQPRSKPAVEPARRPQRRGAGRPRTEGEAWDPGRMVQRSSNVAPRRMWLVPGIFIGVAVVAVVLVALLVLL